MDPLSNPMFGRLDNLITHSKSEEMRVAKIKREQECDDEEEREILRFIEERNTNRRARHANRRTVNSKVRAETNAALQRTGTLGLDPEVRRDSVIAWNSTVKSPLRAKQEERVCGGGLPPTPSVRPMLLGDVGFSLDDHQNTYQRVRSILQNLLPLQKRKEQRRLLVNRLASEFSALFLALHTYEIKNHIVVTNFIDPIEVDACRVLESEAVATDVRFFLDGLRLTIKDYDEIIDGRKRFTMPPIVPEVDDLTTDPIRRWMIGGQAMTVTPQATRRRVLPQDSHDNFESKRIDPKRKSKLTLSSSTEFQACIAGVSSTFLASQRSR